MIVCYGDTCRFFDLYCNKELLNSSVNELVRQYKATQSEEVLSALVNKTIGLIADQAKKLNNPDFTEQDVISHGLEILLKAINSWDENNGVSFTTFLTVLVHNKFDTLAYRSKQYRCYIHTNRYKKPKRPRKKRNQGVAQETSKASLDQRLDQEKQDDLVHLEVSLDGLIETSFDTFGEDDVEPSFQFTVGKKLSSLSNKIIEYLTTYNIKRKCELANAVGVCKDQTEITTNKKPITEEQFNKELRELRKVLKFILV